MNNSFGGYGRYGIALPFGLEVGVERQLRAEASAQIDAAMRGERLRSIVSAGPSVRMLEAPSHGDGAALRAAYWLAVASRVSGQPGLLSEAQRFYAMAGSGFWSSVPDIGPTLAEAESVAKRAGRSDVAAVLNGMRRPYEIQKQSEKWQFRDLLPSGLADPADRSWFLGGWVAGSAALVVAAAVVAAFLLVPSGTASAIGSTALGYARRRRSTVTRAGRKAARKSTRPKRISAAEASRRYMESSPWDDELE
jgi:hypothetical protein